MGDAHEFELLMLIGTSPMPVTIEQLQEMHPDHKGIKKLVRDHIFCGYATEKDGAITVTEGVISHFISFRNKKERINETARRLIEHFVAQGQAIPVGAN